jgi:hypothetical protein
MGATGIGPRDEPTVIARWLRNLVAFITRIRLTGVSDRNLRTLPRIASDVGTASIASFHLIHPLTQQPYLLKHSLPQCPLPHI